MKKRQELWWFAAAVFVATAVVWWRQADAPSKTVGRPMVRDNRTTGQQAERTIVPVTNSTDEIVATRLKHLHALESGFKQYDETMRSWLTNFPQIHTRTTGQQAEWTIVRFTNSTGDSVATPLKQIESAQSAFKELGELTSSWRTNISQVITSRSRAVPSPFRNIDMPRQRELMPTTNSVLAVNAER